MAASLGYYRQLISDYASDSAYGKAAEAAAQAIAKYPHSAELYLLKAQNERRAGQLGAAIASLQKGLELDPKIPGASLLLAQLNFETGKLDEAIIMVKAHLARDSTNTERDAQYLLGLGLTEYKNGVASKRPEAFHKAIKLVQASDEIDPSRQAKFFTAVSAWQIFVLSRQQGKSWKCADARAAEASLTLIGTNMPGGSSVSPEAAAQIMADVPRAQQYVDGQVKRLCK